MDRRDLNRVEASSMSRVDVERVILYRGGAGYSIVGMLRG